MTNATDLPELPQPEGSYFRVDDRYIGGGETIATDDYTADQMIDYGMKCRKPLEEEIAKLRKALSDAQKAFDEIIQDCDKLRASVGLK